MTGYSQPAALLEAFHAAAIEITKDLQIALALPWLLVSIMSTPITDEWSACLQSLEGHSDGVNSMDHGLQT